MKPLQLLIFTLLAFSFLHINLLAQEAPVKLSLEKGTIANRFDYVIKESSSFEDSRVVKTWWLNRLKSHVADSLKGLRSELVLTKKIVTAKNAQIDSLKLALQEVKNSLEASHKEINSIRFVGIPMSKQAYNSLVWMIIFTVAVFMVVFIVLYKRSNLVTKQTKISLEELKEEFESHRKRALEREEKLVNNFHREVNKLKTKKVQ